MNRPLNPVTVTLSAEDAADLQARVERGEFASLDEGVAAELAELNYRRAAEIVGGSEKLEALLDQLETSRTLDPSEWVGGERSLSDMLADLKARAGS
jgi:Arc/MetJ-type ribon-helix-helix transcriptional regulator